MTITLEKFLSRLQTNPTRKSYEFHILKICGSEKDADSFATKSRSEIEEYLIEWITRRKGKISGYTIKTAIASIHSFLNENDRMDINWGKIKNHIPRHRTDADIRIPSIEEIHSLLEVCPMRERAQALTFIASGMREGGLAGLKIRDMQDVSGYPDLRELHVYADSKGEGQDYYTLINGEAISAIDEYLAFRQRSGEVLKPESPLFRNDFSTRNKDTVNSPTHINAESVSALFNRLWQLSGARTRQSSNGGNGGSVRHSFKSVHAFRAFFKTKLESTGMKSAFIEKLMGHTNGVQASYFHPKKEVLDEYSRYMAALYVTENFVQKTQLEELKSSTVAEVKDYRSELVVAQEQIRKMAREQEEDRAKAAEDRERHDSTMEEMRSMIKSYLHRELKED